MEPILRLKNIGKNFEESPRKYLKVLHNIDLEIYAKEFFIFVGPSGSGKSTLLRIMCGLEEPSPGEIRYASGVDRSRISFVFQQFALLPWLTVYENIELGLVADHIEEKKRHERVTQELERFGLTRFANARPRELSGGMRQRVGIARALATDPQIIFMDEPFSELDSFTARELRKEFLAIWGKTDITIVMVTHLVEEALELADRIAVLTPRPARIEKIVENTLPRPRNERSPEFWKLEDHLYTLIRP